MMFLSKQAKESGQYVQNPHNGQFVEIVNYYCFTNYYDTTDIE